MIADDEIPGSLADIYALIPAMPCRGRCQAACGPIDAGPQERQAIFDATGITLPRNALRLIAGQLGEHRPASCPALGLYGQCTAYEVRPGVCRIWGAVQSLACQWGCKPPGGYLSEGRGFAIMAMLEHFQAGDPISMKQAYAITGYIDKPEILQHWLTWRATVNDPYPEEIREEAERRFTRAARRYHKKPRGNRGRFA